MMRRAGGEPLPPKTDEYTRLLRSHGLRATAGRLAALSYLAEHPHSSAADIHRGTAPDLPSLTQQSVHNIVQDLERCGILRRMSPPASIAALYEVAGTGTGQHHHIQCTRCKEVADVHLVEELDVQRIVEHAEGMQVTGVQISFLGICERCQSQ